MFVFGEHRSATALHWSPCPGQSLADCGNACRWGPDGMWGRLADLAQSYLKKGSQVYIEGRLQTRDWEDQQGQKHYKTEVVVTTMQFLDSRISDSEPAQAVASPAFTDSTSSSEYSTNTESNSPDSKQEDDYIKDDIPF